MKTCTRINYKLYAVEQMFSRAITKEEVEYVISNGETIAANPTDKPYPIVLRLAFVGTRPVHIVMSQNSEEECYIVTAYEPNAFLWNIDFRTKKK